MECACCLLTLRPVEMPVTAKPFLLRVIRASICSSASLLSTFCWQRNITELLDVCNDWIPIGTVIVFSRYTQHFQHVSCNLIIGSQKNCRCPGSSHCLPWILAKSFGLCICFNRWTIPRLQPEYRYVEIKSLRIFYLFRRDNCQRVCFGKFLWKCAYNIFC